MATYFALARLAFRRQFTYGAAALSGVVTNAFFGMLRVAVLIALYNGRMEMAGITLEQAVSFAGVTQAIIVYLSFFGWWELNDQVRSGEIGSELLRPLDLFASWFARDIGRACAGLIMRALPTFALFSIFFGVVTPNSLLRWGLFGVTLLLSLWVSFGWRFLINTLSFWTADARGFGRPIFSAAFVLSGFALPLRYFPDWLRTLSAFTPFPATINVPVEAFLGIGSDADIARGIATQLLWALALTATNLWVLSRGVRKLVVQGG
jgi:ABC-2 type transport system permease protein